jgi:hypothetical protein
LPGQEFIETVSGVIGDTREDISKPGLWVDVIEATCLNECAKDSGALAAAIGPTEEPGFSAKGDAAESSLRRIVGQADPAVVEEAGEDLPRRTM